MTQHLIEEAAYASLDAWEARVEHEAADHAEKQQQTQSRLLEVTGRALAWAKGGR